MAKQKTLHEKWAADSKEKDGGVRFHDIPEGERKFVKMEGFTEEEMKQILGEDGYVKYRKDEKKYGTEEIDEV